FDFEEIKRTYNDHYDDTFDEDFKGSYIELEKEALGVYVTDTPMTKHKNLVEGYLTASDIDDVGIDEEKRWAGIIEDVVFRNSKKSGKEFVIVELTDNY